MSQLTVIGIMNLLLGADQYNLTFLHFICRSEVKLQPKTFRLGPCSWDTWYVRSIEVLHGITFLVHSSSFLSLTQTKHVLTLAPGAPVLLPDKNVIQRHTKVWFFCPVPLCEVFQSGGKHIYTLFVNRGCAGSQTNWWNSVFVGMVKPFEGQQSFLKCPQCLK
mgnify:FL=1